jgi:H+/gluconate symporter-like permease
MYIRSKSRPAGRQMSTPVIRGLIVGLYTLYPVGCILQLLPESWGGGTALSVAGLIAVAASLIMFAVLAGSSLQRQAQEAESELDERERADRNKAAFYAHSVFSSAVLLGLIYIMLTTDMAEAGKLDLWRPSTGDHWNAIFWGLGLLSVTLPGAVLAFGKTPPDMD